jgi:hypothetical protein
MLHRNITFDALENAAIAATYRPTTGRCREIRGSALKVFAMPAA